MILELERLGGMFEVTANLSNTFLVAMMPYVSDAAKRLELPLPQPITQQQVVSSRVLPLITSDGEWGGFGVELTDGSNLGFHWGYLDSFSSTNAYYSLQNPDEIPRFVGAVRVTQAEAVQLARATIKKLGIPIEKVFAEQEPRITPPEKTRTGIVPRYRVQWSNPRGGDSVDMEINADAKRVEKFAFNFNPNLHRPWPEVGVKPPMQQQKRKTNPEYALKLLPIVLKAVDEYGKALRLKIPYPLNTNHVARFFVGDNGGWPHTELTLTNGWRFVYRNSTVNGFVAPDALFENDRAPILIKDFVGKWNMTETEAIKLVSQSIAKLNYPTNLVQMDFAPQINRSVVTNIPRYSFWWFVHDKPNGRLVCKVEAEVDADQRVLKSLYFDHKLLWNKSPPIDTPISLPPSSVTNAAIRTKPRVTPAGPSRPF